MAEPVLEIQYRHTRLKHKKGLLRPFEIIRVKEINELTILDFLRTETQSRLPGRICPPEVAFTVQNAQKVGRYEPGFIGKSVGDG